MNGCGVCHDDIASAEGEQGDHQMEHNAMLTITSLLHQGTGAGNGQATPTRKPAVDGGVVT